MAGQDATNRVRGEPPLPPLWAYAIACALLWAVLMPVADWLTGDLVGVGKSALKGAVVGLAWGLAMFPFERWLRRRRPRS